MSSMVRAVMVLNYLDLTDEIDKISNSIKRTMSKWKKRLRRFGDKPNFIHLRSMYRACMNRIFRPYLLRLDVAADSAIFGEVTKCAYHQAKCPGYTPRVWGVPLYRFASIELEAI
jgi:hypothetical protein